MNAKTKKLSGLRVIIAERMMESLASAAQLTYHGELDISDQFSALKRLKKRDVNFGLEDLAIRALVDTVSEMPAFNGWANASSFQQIADINISVAIDTPNGLVAPVVKKAQGKSLNEISIERRRLIEVTRENRLSREELKDGTITISNLGNTPVTFFTPILNPPQICLLGLGRAREVIQPNGHGGVHPRLIMPVSLTADHRFIDGGPAGRFLGKFFDEFGRIDLQI